MTDYGVQAALAGDRHFLRRVAACAASLGVDEPLVWADRNAWKLAVAPGWCCAITDANGDSAAVTDDMIQEAVLKVIESEPVPPVTDLPTDPEPVEPEPDNPEEPHDGI